MLYYNLDFNFHTNSAFVRLIFVRILVSFFWRVVAAYVFAISTFHDCSNGFNGICAYQFLDMSAASFFDITNMLSCYDYFYCIRVIFVCRLWNQLGLIGLEAVFIYPNIKQIFLDKL